jgi:hypothetical protein
MPLAGAFAIYEYSPNLARPHSIASTEKAPPLLAGTANLGALPIRLFKSNTGRGKRDAPIDAGAVGEQLAIIGATDFFPELHQCAYIESGSNCPSSARPKP